MSPVLDRAVYHYLRRLTPTIPDIDRRISTGAAEAGESEAEQKKQRTSVWIGYRILDIDSIRLIGTSYLEQSKSRHQEQGQEPSEDTRELGTIE